nr:DUF3263 domain-containing protein [Angustibacter aerolatus]
MDAAHSPSPAETVGGGDSDLSERDREILAFERQWWKYAGAKEQAVREPVRHVGHPVLPGAERAHRPPGRARLRPDAGEAAAPHARLPSAGPLGPPARPAALGRVRPEPRPNRRAPPPPQPPRGARAARPRRRRGGGPARRRGRPAGRWRRR